MVFPLLMSLVAKQRVVMSWLVRELAPRHRAMTSARKLEELKTSAEGFLWFLFILPRPVGNLRQAEKVQKRNWAAKYMLRSSYHLQGRLKRMLREHQTQLNEASMDGKR